MELDKNNNKNMNKRYLMIVSGVLLIGLFFGLVQYLGIMKIDFVSAVTVGTPDPGHTWASMECSANTICVDTTNNRVGIGTNTPAYNLTVASSSATNVYAALQNSATGYATTDGVQLAVDASGVGYLINRENTNLVFRTNNADQMFISNAGNVQAANEIISTMGAGYGQFRAVSGNYGTFIRNDGANTYLLLTDSGNQYGTWNALRPFVLNDATGAVSINNGLTANYLYVNPQDSTNEGGEISLKGAGTNGSIQIDNYAGNARIFSLAAGKQLQVLGGGLYVDGQIRACDSGGVCGYLQLKCYSASGACYMMYDPN